MGLSRCVAYWCGAATDALHFLAVLAALLFALLPLQGAIAQDEFLDPAQAFVFSAAMSSPDELDVHFRIAPDYYMYRERFGFKTTDGILSGVQFPPGQIKYDPTFDQDMEVYYQQVTVRLLLSAGLDQPQELHVTGQGCADAGLCYPPMNYTLQLIPTAQGYKVEGEAVALSVPPPSTEIMPQAAVPAQPQAGARALDQILSLEDTGLAAYLTQTSALKLIGLALLLGVLLTFTPCVLPMVPIVLAVVAGDAGRDGKISRWRGLGLAGAYVLGMSVVYTVLGVLAGLIGASLAVWLQTPWVLTFFAVLLALLALAMFDVYTFQAPTGMQSRLSTLASRIPGGKWGGAFVIGMVSALIVGPCIAAPLAGVLLFISQTGDVVLGGSALFAMAWGQGLLLLVLGATSGVLMPRAGLWMEGVKYFFGMLLLATAWWMVQPVVAIWVGMLGWAVLGLCSAVMLGIFKSKAAAAGLAGLWHSLLRAVGLVLAIWSVLLLVGLAAGSRDALRPLAPFALSPGAAQGQLAALDNKPVFVQVQSVAQLDELLAAPGRPVMLDFYADWCISCIQMERYTFSDPAVAQRMSRMLLVQADVTHNTQEDRALLRRFKLFGPPGIIFFDRQGRQLDERVIGFKNAAQFAEVLERLQ